MAPAFTEEKLDEIRNSADIVEVVGRYVSLTKQGRYFKGLCPFHPEKTPSFSVNPERRIFKCFGCGEGGNVFSFLMKHTGMTFPEAVRELASMYNIDLPQGRPDPHEAARSRQRERELAICRLAAAYYTANLKSGAGEAARRYLADRDIPDEVVERYGLGWAADSWDGLIKALGGRRVPDQAVARAGLALERRSGRGYYDRFRGRLIIPIRDSQSRVVAFGGRGLTADVEPKYLNSPETEVFKKGRLLYGLAEARDSIRASGRVVVVEGYFDVLALASAGIGYAVASMGTALTGGQVRQLRGLAAQVVLVFDPDAAGLKAALRAEEVFTAERIAAKIQSLPDGLDPDDFVREKGATEFETLLDRAQPMVAFAVDRLLDRPLDTPEQKGAALADLAPVLGRIASPVEQAAYIQVVAGRLRVDERAVMAGLSRPGRTVEVSRAPTRSSGSGMETGLVAAMVNHPDCASALMEAGVMEVLSDPVCRRVAGAVSQAGSVAGLIDYLDPEAAQFVSQVTWDESPSDLEGHVKQLVDTVSRLKRRRLSREIIDQIAEAEAVGDHDKVLRLLAQKRALDRV